MNDGRLSRQQASDAVGDIGWRFLLGTLRTSVRVRSLAQAAEVAIHAVAAAGPTADGQLLIDIRHDRVVLAIHASQAAALTEHDIELAHRVSVTVAAFGLRTEPEVVRTEPEVGGRTGRSVQLLEIAIDALDIAAIRPFWKAVLGYTDEPGRTGPEDRIVGPIVDPVGQGPAIWFQQMDAPRPQRNRIHFDLCVPHDEAAARIQAALDAGGELRSADRAPAFWVLADAEGNEVCVTTWQGRDP